MALTHSLRKKRIRKNFGKRRRFWDVPYLLSIQVDSYNKFRKPQNGLIEREDKGLPPAFPIPYFPDWSVIWAMRP